MKVYKVLTNIIIYLFIVHLTTLSSVAQTIERRWKYDSEQWIGKSLHVGTEENHEKPQSG